MVEMKSKHTPGATKAAKIILNGKKLIETSYGDKNAEGIADLIDRETAAGELLGALRDLFEHCAMIHKNWGENCNSQQADAAVARAQAAIAKAER